MKKADLHFLVQNARRSTDIHDIAATAIIFEFADRRRPNAPSLRRGQPNEADLKSAAIDVVHISEEQGWPVTASVRAMLEWAVGMRPTKKKRGRPVKEAERERAVIMEATVRLRMAPPLSDAQFAKMIDISRPTLTKWRHQAGFEESVNRLVAQVTAEFDGLVQSLAKSTRRREL